MVRRHGVEIVAALVGQRGFGGNQAGNDRRIAEIVNRGAGGNRNLGTLAGSDDLALAHDQHRIDDSRPIAWPKPGATKRL